MGVGADGGPGSRQRRARLMAAALRLVVGLVLPVELLEALGFRLGGALVPAAGLHRLPEWPGSPTESSTLTGGTAGRSKMPLFSNSQPNAVSREHRSTFQLRRVCSKIVAFCFCSGSQVALRWLPSEWNPSDNPSRGRWTPRVPQTSSS